MSLKVLTKKHFKNSKGWACNNNSVTQSFAFAANIDGCFFGEKRVYYIIQKGFSVFTVSPF
jgi:hypothetical protein